MPVRRWRPRLVRPRRPRTPRYDQEVVAALAFCWAVLGAPNGKRLVPIMGELAPRLRRLDELQVTEEAAVLLVGMSRRRWTVGSLPIGPRCSFADAATPSRVRCRSPRSRSGRRGCLSGCATRADWDDAAPGFVEIDLVGHEGGNAMGDHCYTRTVTDIATGRTENRSVRNKARRRVIAQLEHISLIMCSRPSASIPTTVASSSTTTCSTAVSSGRSPSPARIQGAATTARTWNRRTGPSYALWSATTARTRPPNSCC